MDDVDAGLFDRDWNNTLYYFMLNDQEQIYMRYGGRDAASPDTYLNLESLELALKQGLELHRQYLAGELRETPRPKPLYPREMPLLVERTFARNQCVECHLIGDYQNLQREQDGALDMLAHVYRSPDIKTLGIFLDAPKGLVVKDAQGAARAAGMRPGDRIAALDGTPVWTFGDLQYRYDQVNRKARRIEITVEREGNPVALPVALPPKWWWTDLRFRQSSVEPRTYFEDRALTPEEKSKHGLDPGGFASQVKYVADFARVMKTHDLRVGDIIVAVDGAERDELADTADLFIKLRKRAGAPVTLQVLRNGERLEIALKTYRMSFRK
jgi:hypothetical protein